MHYSTIYVHSQFLCCLVYISAVQRDARKVAYPSNTSDDVAATDGDEFPFSVSLYFPFPSFLSSWSAFMTYLMSFPALSLVQLFSPPLSLLLAFIFISFLFFSWLWCCHRFLTAGHFAQNFCSPHKDQWDDGRLHAVKYMDRKKS